MNNEYDGLPDEDTFVSGPVICEVVGEIPGVAKGVLVAGAAIAGGTTLTVFNSLNTSISGRCVAWPIAGMPNPDCYLVVAHVPDF